MQRRDFIENLLLFVSSTLTFWRFFSKAKRKPFLPTEAEIRAQKPLLANASRQPRLEFDIRQKSIATVRSGIPTRFVGGAISLSICLNGVTNRNGLCVWNQYHFKLTDGANKRLALAVIEQILDEFVLTPDESKTLEALQEMVSYQTIPYVVPQMVVFNAFTPE